MSKKSEITVAERQILDFIKFRSNERHRFFGSNEYIGNSIGLQKTSVKNMVNKLVRLEYLTRTMEGNKRYLQYTGKKYLSVVGDLSNYDKAYLRKQVAHYRQEYSFVDWFIMNKAKDIPIPYVEQNQKNKLRQLAQQNNREFKKLLHDKA